MSADAYKSFEVRALEVYDALVACRLERDVALAENQRLREALERIAAGKTALPHEVIAEEALAGDAERDPGDTYGPEYGYTLATGHLFCDFGSFQEWASDLVGRSLMTHQFTDPAVWAALREAFEADVLEREALAGDAV